MLDGAIDSREIVYIVMPSFLALLFGTLLLAVAGRRPIADEIGHAAAVSPSATIG
ncbi:hypothetical protein [Sphingomonas sp. ERG5]|uniref:hypothetical protein n=1 Tax=Sphingomonas sp. ERG5 TaxID=1381597 RepID=UPI000B26213A|nr:hypothetical protein [Sphingomonas sp. ERG5]